jgi:hypothetical protein
MKYDLKAFNNAVKYYEKSLSKFKGKTIFIVFDAKDEKAFFSMAPLSRAAHNLKCELNVSAVDERSEAIDALIDVWRVFEDLQQGVKNPATLALKDYVAEVDKKAKGVFKKTFRMPELFVEGTGKEFITSEGFKMKYDPSWFKRYRWNDLLATGKIVWKQVYDLKKSEKVGIGFDLIMKADEIKNPLEDYFDSYAIARTAYITCPAKTKTMKSSTSKKTQLEPSERTSELQATLLGCELEKDIDEPVFKKFKKLSKLLKLDRLRTNDATFFVKGEGYGGRHIFGEFIGYPTPNKKSRWESPSGIIYQFPWYPQTKIDSRAPRTRLGFTDTLPIDIYIESCRIDWLKMKKIDDKLIALVNRSEKIFVESGKTKLEVGLRKKDGGRRLPMNSDVDIRTMLDKDALKKGIKAGNMANIPGGEMFLTPEYIKGTFYGDVVISIDKSYVLNAKNPLVIKCEGNNYKILGGPKDVVKKLIEKKNEAMKVLLKQEKNKSLPASIIAMKKKNFNNLGEFAINTNPKARLCNYLIVNEKIAGMMHIALGSGYEEDRPSVYHYDVVINAKAQKLDIFGVDKKGSKNWMLKKGKLAV